VSCLFASFLVEGTCELDHSLVCGELEYRISISDGLWGAAVNGHLDAVKYLAGEQGADNDAKLANGMTEAQVQSESKLLAERAQSESEPLTESKHA
jgi:hypothetical protein